MFIVQCSISNPCFLGAPFLDLKLPQQGQFNSLVQSNKCKAYYLTRDPGTAVFHREKEQVIALVREYADIFANSAVVLGHACGGALCLHSTRFMQLR